MKWELYGGHWGRSERPYRRVLISQRAPWVQWRVPRERRVLGRHWVVRGGVYEGYWSVSEKRTLWGRPLLDRVPWGALGGPSKRLRGGHWGALRGPYRKKRFPIRGTCGGLWRPQWGVLWGAAGELQVVSTEGFCGAQWGSTVRGGTCGGLHERTCEGLWGVPWRSL